MTSDLNSLYLVGKLVLLLFQTLSNLAIAAVSVAILMRNSAVLLPFLVRVAPRYLKLSTFSNLSPFVM